MRDFAIAATGLSGASIGMVLVHLERQAARSVVIQIDDELTFLSPFEARRVAKALLQAAQEAEPKPSKRRKK